MKHKTADLTGADLDAAVALAYGRIFEIEPYRVTPEGGITFVRKASVCVVDLQHFAPSKQWDHGGPIIQRERIQLMPWKPWLAHIASWTAITLDGQQCHAHTPLIAAMRAYVASKLGEEVELP